MGTTRAVGIDLGGTKILAGIVSADGRVGRSVECATPRTAEAILDSLALCVRELIVDEVAGEVAAVGIGVPAVLDPVTRVALNATNLPLENVDFRALLGASLGIPVAIENDGNAAALAEWRFGAGRDARDLVMLTLGTGVGGGLVLAGRPYAGWAELGHLVVQADGPRCQGSCHGRGHLEGFVSGSAADAVAARLYGEEADARVLIARAESGDVDALAEVERMGRFLGIAIGSLVNLFRPDVVVVGGGFGIAAGELLLGPARAAALREAVPPADRQIALVPAALGARAGLVGAALVGLAALDGD
jgi:glucokinase